MEDDTLSDQDTPAEVEINTATELEELRKELHVSKALVVELNTEKEQHYQELMNLEQHHNEEMSTKDDIIVNLKRELAEAHEKIRVLESKTAVENLTDPTNPIPADTLSTLLTQSKPK
jgi:predicted RNase H-like nuclease (RuvC/YqgF family)